MPETAAQPRGYLRPRVASSTRKRVWPQVKLRPIFRNTVCGNSGGGRPRMGQMTRTMASFAVKLLCGSETLLEEQPQRQLDDARLRVRDAAAGRAGAGNLTKRAAGEGGVWSSEQWMVQSVEHFRAELQPHSLVNIRPFSDA